MQYMLDFFNAYSNNIVALIVAFIIFIITVMLLTRKIIGCLITLALLFFAIFSGLVIANNDLVREFIVSYTEQSAKNKQIEDQQKMTERIHDDFEALKDSFSEQLEEFKEWLDKWFKGEMKKGEQKDKKEDEQDKRTSFFIKKRKSSHL